MMKRPDDGQRCCKGHLLTNENTYLAGGRLRCSACRHLSVDATRRKNRATQFYQAVEYLGGSCFDCGYKDNLNALEFDHVRGTKMFTIGSMLHRPWNILLEEIKKCELVCANCHRIRTAARGQVAYANRQTLLKERLAL